MTDGELLRQFESRALPFDQWTHRAHVKVAYLYLLQHPFPDALAKLRQHIQAYNAANQVPEGPTSGYNETTTHALLHLIAAVMQHYKGTHPVSTADDFYDVHPQFHSKHVLRLFYTPARRTDPRAKSQFLPPDLTPLPRLLE